MFRNRVFGVSASLAGAALLVALGSTARVSSAAPAAAQAAAQEGDRGERLMNASCQGCHDLRQIQTQAMDLASWTKTIESMVAQGADVAKDDIPVLAEYLTRHHGPMPDGRGKEVVLQVCTMCHDLSRIKLGRRSPEEWEETLISMLNEGAPLSDDAFPVVHAYLSRNFGVE
jgi:cytochrome c5